MEGQNPNSRLDPETGEFFLRADDLTVENCGGEDRQAYPLCAKCLSVLTDGMKSSIWDAWNKMNLQYSRVESPIATELKYTQAVARAVDYANRMRAHDIQLKEEKPIARGGPSGPVSGPQNSLF